MLVLAIVLFLVIDIFILWSVLAISSRKSREEERRERNGR